MLEHTPKIPIDGTPLDPAFKADRARQNVAAPSRAPSAASVAEQLRGGTACFGGTLFRRENSFHFPEICFAVKGLDEYAVRRAEQHYAGLRHRCPTVPLIPCSRIEQDGEYTVFSFALGEQERPLRQIMTVSENALRPMALLKKLVRFLQDYHGCVTAGGKTYTPLCCLTPDTVYLDLEHRVRILPLLQYGTARPTELPPETGTDAADVTSDLYSAAYLYVELLSLGRSKLAAPDDPTVQRMLAAAPEWRPELTDAVQALLSDTPVPAEAPPEKKPLPDLSGAKEAAARVWNRVKGPAGRLKTKVLGSLHRPSGDGGNTMTFHKEE